MSKLMPRKYFNLDPDQGVLIGIVIFWLLLFLSTGSLWSGFHFIDDHEIVMINHDLMTANLNLLEVIGKWIHYDYNHARFRPLYYLHRVIATDIFGLNWFLWYLQNAFLAIITTWLLYKSARVIEFTVQESLFLASLTLLGEPAIIWWRLGTPETIAIPLLAIALLCAALAAKSQTTRWQYDSLFVIFACLTALCKEAMILFLPAVGLIRIWLESYFNPTSIRQSIKSCLLSILGLTVIFGSAIFYIWRVIGLGGTGYAGVGQDSLNLEKIWTACLSLFEAGYLWIPVSILSLTSLLAIKDQQFNFNRFKSLISVVIIFFVAIIPQVFLYAKSGLIGHYFLPAVWACALLTVYTLRWHRDYSRWGGRVFSFAIVLIIGISMVTTWKACLVFAQDGHRTQALLNQLQRCTIPNQPILVVANPRVNFELSNSLKRYLTYAAQRDQLFLATYGIENAHFFSDSYQDEEAGLKFLDPKTVDSFYKDQTVKNIKNKNQIKAIVVLSSDKLKQDFLSSAKDWFDPANYQESNYRLDYASVSITLYCRNM
ncbi:MAG: glycosyltransferase family 39 protein [Aphanocapsa sp. GSE-SYN-MK-11-07L]|jgi:hypothetical protein|nr:glycosyltransferase family 39 protein [Aphanocapsa sp. GSE-SYN-MK-11-07L]